MSLSYANELANELPNEVENESASKQFFSRMIIKLNDVNMKNQYTLKLTCALDIFIAIIIHERDYSCAHNEIKLSLCAIK